MYMNPSINFKYYEASEKSFIFLSCYQISRPFRVITKKETKKNQYIFILES